MADGQLLLADAIDRTTQAGEILSFVYRSGVWCQVLTGADATNPFGINVKTFGATGDGSTDDRAAIDKAQTAAVAVGAPLLFPASVTSYRIASDLTITVPCIFRGGVLKLDSAKIVMFNKSIDPFSSEKIFDVTYSRGLAADSDATALPGIRFDPDSGQNEVRPQWWGAVADGSTDCADAIQQAIDSVSLTGSNTHRGVPVMLSAGIYGISHEIFVGYDFVNKDNTDTYLCRSANGLSPSGRMSPVPLTGEGLMNITYIGDVHTNQSSKYLVYYSPAYDSASGARLGNIILTCGWQRRGFYINHLGYQASVENLVVQQSREIGFDIHQCYSLNVEKLSCTWARGIGIRTVNFNGSSARLLQYSSDSKGTNASSDYWPDPTETHVRDYTDTVIQTAVENRGAYCVNGGNCSLDSVNIENAHLSWPFKVAASYTESKAKIQFRDHQFTDGDKFYYDGGVRSFAAVPSSSYFYLDYDPGAAVAATYLHRVVESITEATLGVVSLRNHRLADGDLIKFTAATGMEELDSEYNGAAGNWYTAGPSVEPYNTGTLEIEDGVVTLSGGGTFPAWAAGGILTVGNKAYVVDIRTDDTHVTLESLEVNVAASAVYNLNAAMEANTFGIYGFRKDTTTGVLIAVDTSGFTSSDNTEYLSGGGGSGIVVDTRYGMWTNLRFEANDCAFSSIRMRAAGRNSNTIMDFTSWDAPCRHVVYFAREYQHPVHTGGTHTHYLNRISGLRGRGPDGGAEVSVIEVDIGLNQYAFGNTFDTIGVASGTIPTVHWNEEPASPLTYRDGNPIGKQGGNLVDGVPTSVVDWTQRSADAEVKFGTDPDATPEVKMIYLIAGHHAQWTAFQIDDHTVDITAFDSGYEGQEITVLVASNANAIAFKHNVESGTDSTKLRLIGETDLTPAANTLLKFVRYGEIWYQEDHTFPKIKHTSIGGMAILLTNNTGAETIAGTLVECDDTIDDAFELGDANSTHPVGIVLDSGIANGEEAWVVVSGVADIAMEDNTSATRGYWVRTSVTEVGYSDASNPAPPGAGIGEVERHFTEIGHCIESVSATGGGTHILARCVLHFN